jgi:glycine C-acetyltransferase
MVDEARHRLRGRTGRGTLEHCGVMGRVDIVTGTLGKALGGALGGFTAARREIVSQRGSARGPPTRTACRWQVGGDRGVRPARGEHRAADRLDRNTRWFREAMTAAGDITPGIHPIVPIMLYDERLATTARGGCSTKGST